MKCAICKHGDTAPGTTTVTLERASATVVFKNVPADVCSTCGETYVSERVASRLLSCAEEAVGSGVETEIRAYAEAV